MHEANLCFVLNSGFVRTALSVNRLQEQKIKSWVCGKSSLKLLVCTDVLIEAIKYAWHCGSVMVRILTVYVRIKSCQQWAGWANY